MPTRLIPSQVALDEQQAARAAVSDCSTRATQNSRAVKKLAAELDGVRAALAATKDEARRAQLTRKQHQAAAKRTTKALEGVQESRQRLDDDERSAQMETAEAMHALREARGSLSLEQPKLHARERALLEHASYHASPPAPSMPARAGGHKRQREGAMAAPKAWARQRDATLDPATRLREIEAEIREIDSWRAADEPKRERQAAAARQREALEKRRTDLEVRTRSSWTMPALRPGSTSPRRTDRSARRALRPRARRSRAPA